MLGASFPATVGAAGRPAIAEIAGQAGQSACGLRARGPRSRRGRDPSGTVPETSSHHPPAVSSLTASPGSSNSTRPPLLLGRDSESSRIQRLLDRARQGCGGGLLVLGEPGIGKTALLDLAVAQADEMDTLRARGVAAEADLPYIHGGGWWMGTLDQSDDACGESPRTSVVRSRRWTIASYRSIRFLSPRRIAMRRSSG